jgi:hypothetical protein
MTFAKPMNAISKRTYLYLKLAALAIVLLAFVFSSCNKKCSSLEATNSGEVVSLYDFKECFVYATFDSILVIDSDTAFDNYKKSHFITCKPSLDPIDFSKHILLGFKTSTHACNAAFHRNIELDHTNKIYRFTVTIETCKGCGTPLLSTNFVIGPQIPAGYTLQFIKKEP